MSDEKLQPVGYAGKLYLVTRAIQYERLPENQTALKLAKDHFTDFFKWLSDLEKEEGIGK